MMIFSRSVLPLFAALGAAWLCFQTSSVGAAAAKAPSALEQARVKFAAAVAAKDRAAVAKLSRFPLAIEGYELAPKLTEAEFLRDKNRFNGLFFEGDSQLVACLKTQPFTYQADAKQFGARLWQLDCNGNEYFFGEDHGRWAFAAYQNINE